jgi:heterotetrameric sarcosine oxidase gamma subunit
VTDQSDARALVRIHGREARAMLAKGLSIDLHPSVFAAGHAATTNLAHVTVQIWQMDDAPTYMLAVPRSFATGVWSFLTAASGEYGLGVGPRSSR